MMVDCPAEDVLGAFVSGALSGEVAADVEQHLADCSRCAATVAVAFSGPAPTDLEDPEALERELGRYHILGVAGRGAVGLVYAAYDPKLDRKVALKFLRRPGRELEARLEREARAMARVRSPHVVAVHDVGVAAGRLYVAMEYVEGQTLREWLAERKRSAAEVLAAFLQAGRGLAAAHAAGVVHRDFKPDNVLVRPGGQVAVSDFGLALAGGDPDAGGAEPAADDLHLTSTGTMVGTPAYMAPEQLDGGRGDERSDLFAFCVSLFAALTRRHPFPTASLTQLSAAAHEGQVSLPAEARLPRRVREALLAGLRPRPEERPASMAALLARLEPRPVQRASLALAGAFLVAALAAVLALATPAREAAQPCQGAQRLLSGVWDDERRGAVRAGLLATGSPLAEGAARTVETALDAYAARWLAAREEACLATRVRGEQSEAALDGRDACLDERRLRLGALVRSLEHASREQVAGAEVEAFDLPPASGCADPRSWSDAAPPASPAQLPLIALARASAAQAYAQGKLGSYDEAFRRLAPALAVTRSTGYRPLEAEVRLTQGLLAFGRDPRLSEESLQAAAVAGQAAGRMDLAGKAWVFLARRIGGPLRAAEAGRLADYAEALLDRQADPLLRADLLDARAIIAGKERPAEALALHRKALLINEALLGPDHPALVSSLKLVAGKLVLGHGAAEALPLAARAVAIGERALGRDHPLTLDAKALQARVLRELGRHDEALALLEEVLGASERVNGPWHPVLAEPLGALALIHYDMARYAEGAAELRRLLAIEERAFGADAAALTGWLGFQGTMLARLGDFAAADEAARRAVAIAEKLPDERNFDLRQSLVQRGKVLQIAGRCAEAIPVLERSLALAADPAEPVLAPALDSIGECQLALGKTREAEASYLRALAVREKAVGPAHPFLTVELAQLARIHHQRGDDARARELAARAVEILASHHQAGNNLGEARLVLAMTLWSSDRPRARAQASLAASDLAPYPDLPARRELEAWRAKHP